MARPLPGDHYESYQAYIDETTGNTVADLITNHAAVLNDFIAGLPESKGDYAYAADKWTVKDLLQHLIDTERIMTYRALTIARQDTVSLPGFEENAYAISAKASLRSLASLKEEFLALRKATDYFLLALTEEQLQQKGISNGHLIKVNSLAFIIIGHHLHHKKVMEARYL